MFNVNTKRKPLTLLSFLKLSHSPSLRKSRMHRAKSYPDNRQEFSGESNPQETLLPMFNILSVQREILCSSSTLTSHGIKQCDSLCNGRRFL